ncbi:hypothetical protein P879_06144 [Paragonimus westermani]|uniref:Uncharacterized protein n=1 Tax=Paragonimus westermani TaxID=34504 RepID=A0A8T0DE75_9TREM|nr:hypothetical protein P879_06144 [Paragonimus westermani]
MSSLNSANNHRPYTTNSLHDFSHERTRLEHSLSDTRQIRQTTDQEDRDLRSLIFRLEDDKKRLAQRIEKLCANERALVLELERLKRHGTSGLSLSRGKMFNRLEEHLHGVEADRDYWRNQVELLQQMMANPRLVGRGGSTNRGTSGRIKCKPPSGQTPTKAVLKSREAPLIKVITRISHRLSKMILFRFSNRHYTRLILLKIY